MEHISQAGRGFRLSCLILLAMVYSTAQAQTVPDSPKHVTLGAGLLHLQAVEGTLYPRRNTGPGLHLDLQAEKRKQERIREWQLLVQYARPRTAVEQETSSHWVRLRIRANQLWPVARGAWGQLQAGPMAALNYQVAYYENLDESHLYWANHATLGASVRWQRPRLNQEASGFQARLDLPVLGLASRPPQLRPYKIDDLSGGGILQMLHGQLRPVWWGQLLAPQGELAYRLTPSGRRTRAFFYGMEYQWLSLGYSRSYQHLVHQAGFRLTL
jgi:hypothetical protein